MSLNQIKQNELKRLIEKSKRAVPNINVAELEPIIVSNDGYILTADERIMMRMAVGSAPVNLWRSETKSLGLDHRGVTVDEAYAYISRMAALPVIEDAALDIQRKAALLRKALVALLQAAQSGNMPTSGQIVAAAMIVRDTE